jgi:opacity protein-like surface antigen
MKKTLLASASMLALMLASAASAATVTWTGPSDFDDELIAFTGFSASQITGITGGGYGHNHGDLSVVFGLELELDGVWTSVSTATIDGHDHVLAEIFVPSITFTTATVTGLRLLNTPQTGNGFHGFADSLSPTVFEFDTAATTPEPGTVSMLVAGLGLIAFRRFKK